MENVHLQIENYNSDVNCLEFAQSVQQGIR